MPLAFAGELVASGSTDDEGRKKRKGKRIKPKTRRYLFVESTEYSKFEIYPFEYNTFLCLDGFCHWNWKNC